MQTEEGRGLRLKLKLAALALALGLGLGLALALPLALALALGAALLRPDLLDNLGFAPPHALRGADRGGVRLWVRAMARVRARAALCQEKVGSACSAFGVFGLGLWPGLGLGRLSVRNTLAQPAQPSAPAGSPEAAFSARSSLRLPQAPASLGLSAG